ncbi:MAG: hypothetical protein HYV29_03385 [Ignavibacteriales bacterium]|nr:hypothetical protein [Ignavibacteriales bacterium]
MKLFLMILTVALSAFGIAQQQKSATPAKPKMEGKQQGQGKEYLKTVQDKLSYVLGYDVGQKMIGDMASKGLDLNPKVFLRAINDAFEGKNPMLSDIEARNTMMLFEQLMKATPEERKKLQQQIFEKK